MSKSQDTVPVNRTKLYRPPFTADYISRDALEARLEENIGLPLTVVSAPVGYGKSTLISHWLDNSDFPGAWLSLDESDTDIRFFLTYFVTALRATDNHDIGAVVFECTELSPHAVAIQNAVRLPVYDFTTMIKYMYSAAVRRPFTGHI